MIAWLILCFGRFAANDPVYGARPLRREVECQVENPLAMKIVKGEIPEHSQVRIRAKHNTIEFNIVAKANG